MGKSLFTSFMDKLLQTPIWIKQAIFLSLARDLNTYLSEDFLKVDEGDFFQTYRPKLSDAGKSELGTKMSNFDEKIYLFLQCCLQNKSLIEMAVENDFTMEEIAKAFTLCKGLGHFSKDIPYTVSTVAGFVSGKYRTGEYFIHNGKLTVEELDTILAKQREMSENGEHVFIADLMVQMGYVNETDVKSIMFIKEEAGKHFVIDATEIPSISVEKEKFDIRVENTRLQEENKILKEKMNAILNFIKEHKTENV